MTDKFPLNFGDKLDRQPGIEFIPKNISQQDADVLNQAVQTLFLATFLKDVKVNGKQLPPVGFPLVHLEQGPQQKTRIGL